MSAGDPASVSLLTNVLGHPVSARQNKKQRKGRGNVHQRERTVTTLTEDPNTHYLVPTPSEEPQSFNNPKMHNIQMASPFQMGGSFQYGSYPPFNPIQQQQQPFFGPSQQQQPPLQSQSQQQQQQSHSQTTKPTLPPGKNDLDILQNLKKIIKDGQHPFFRAIPQPAALASVYLGPISSQSQAQGRRGETLADSAEGQSAAGTIGISGPAPTSDTGRRQPPRIPQGKDRRPSFASVSPGGTLKPKNNVHDKQAGSPDLPPNRIGSNMYHGQDDLLHPGGWGPSDKDRTTLRPSTMEVSVHTDTRPIGADADRSSSPASGRDDRFPPPGGATRSHDNRERDPRREDWQQSDRLLPQSSSSHDRQKRTADARGRPLLTPPEHRQYDVGYNVAPTRHVEVPSDDASGMQVEDPRLLAATTDGHPLHAPDYVPPNRAPSDSRHHPVDSRPKPDSRGASGNSRGPSVDSRSEHVGSGIGAPSRASTSDRVVLPQPQAQSSAAAADPDDIQSSRSSSLRPTDVTNQNLGSVPSLSEEGMVGGARSDMPLGDNGPRSSLKDRLVPSQSADRVSPEHPSNYGDRPGSHPGRPKFYKDRGGGGGALLDDPPRPGPGNGGPMSGGVGQVPPRSFHPHSPPPEGRGAKPLSSQPGVAHRHPFRGPPLGRPIVREDRGNYRPEYDPRRPDVLDDTLPRYADRSYRDFTPPLGEIPRGGAGGERGGRPTPFPSSPGRAHPDGDISGRRGEWHYHQYSPSVPPNWDVEERWARSGDRDRFERGVPPRSAEWDYRGERDFIARGAFSFFLHRKMGLSFCS